MGQEGMPPSARTQDRPAISPVSDAGGRGGIRTHGTLAGTPVFKTGALNHSATLPSREMGSLSARPVGAQCGWVSATPDGCGSYDTLFGDADGTARKSVRFTRTKRPPRFLFQY